MAVLTRPSELLVAESERLDNFVFWRVLVLIGAFFIGLAIVLSWRGPLRGSPSSR